MKKNLSFLLIFLIFCSVPIASQAQEKPLSQAELQKKLAAKHNPYNLQIINTIDEYRKWIEQSPQNTLINIEEYIPNIKLDIRYATENNFTKTQVYTQPKAYLIQPAAEALKKAQEELNKEGLGFVIYDAYRPYAATLYFKEVYHDTTFVASPRTGSIHNRGCAVDLALIDIKTGKYLKMPTEFDSFTEKAASGYMKLTPKQLRNREKLKNIMIQYGFSINADEWWHYNLKDSQKYPLIDISFEELDTL